jgi:hypothetical protein
MFSLKKINKNSGKGISLRRQQQKSNGQLSKYYKQEMKEISKI